MRRHRFLLFLAAVFAAKLVVVLQLRDHPLLQVNAAGFESTAYATLAARVQSGDLRVPVYALFLALVMSVTNVIAAIRIVQIALGTVAVAAVFVAARAWFGERAAWVAALFAALTGLFSFYEATILPSALDPFLTATALAALALALTSGDRGRKKYTWSVVTAVAFALLLLNRPALWQGGLHFYIGNNPASDGTYRPLPGIAAEDPVQQRQDARTIAEASAGRRLSDAGVSAYFYELGRSWINLHPADAAVHFGRKLALALNGGHAATSYSFPFFAYDAQTLLAGLFAGPWLLFPLGLVGLAAGVFYVRRREYLIWVSFLPLYAIAIAVFFVTERVRLPLLVPLCVGAGALVDVLIFRSAWQPSRLARFGALAAVAITAVLTNLPLRREDGRAEDRTRMAEAMIVRDRIGMAESWTALAETIHPRPAELHRRVGQRLVVHSRPDAAIANLQRALTLDPSSADANFAMGQALLQLNRPREAIAPLRAALKGGVRERLVGYELARALAAVGDRAGALQTLQAVRVTAGAGSAKAGPDTPSDADVWYALGSLALQLESPSLAAVFLNGAIAAAPRSARAHRDLGVALILMGRHPDAVVHFERAAALDPTDTVTQRYLSRLRQYLRSVR